MIPDSVLADIENSKVVLNGKQYNLADFTEIDQEMLSDEFAGQASAYAYVGMLVAEAEAALNDVKMEKDIIYSEADADYREQYNKRGEKYTEAVIRSAVVMDGDYIKVVKEETEVLKAYKTLKALHDAMRQRGEMLISLGATLRSEAQFTDLHINQLKDQLRK